MVGVQAIALKISLTRLPDHCDGQRKGRCSWLLALEGGDCSLAGVKASQPTDDWQGPVSIIRIIVLRCGRCHVDVFVAKNHLEQLLPARPVDEPQASALMLVRCLPPITGGSNLLHNWVGCQLTANYPVTYIV